MTAGLAGSVSVSAQQLTEQQANQAAQARVDAFNAAFKAKDTGAIAARYTEDGIRVTGSGETLVGRTAPTLTRPNSASSCRISITVRGGHSKGSAIAMSRTARW